MMREYGIVVQLLDAETARVAMDAAGHAGCRSCGFCRRDPAAANRLLLDLRMPTPLKVGDRVAVEIPGPGQVWSSILLLLIPLLLFIAGVVVGESLRESGRIDAGSWLSVLIGIVAMAAAYLFAALYDRRLRRLARFQPRIVEWPGSEQTTLDRPPDS